MRKKILSYIYNFIIKHPILIIIFSLFLGILFFMAFKYIPLEADYVNLLPQNSEPVKNLRFLTKKLKGVGQFSIVIESKNKDIEAMKKFSDHLNQELLKIPEIQYIQYKLPLDFIMNNLFLFIETEDLEEIYNRVHEKVQYELWKDVPFYLSFEEEEVKFNIDDIIERYKAQKSSITVSETEYMISEDKKILVMFIKPDFMPTEVNKTGALIDKIKQIIKKLDIKKYGEDLNISFAGTYTLSYDQKNAIYKDIRLTSLIALFFIFIAILFFIQRLNYSIFLLYSLAIGVLSAFGIAYIIFHHINLITGFLIAILTGLGVNYGIHFLFRYKEELKITAKERALKHAFIYTGLASLTGALTTAVSFFSLSFSKFLGFSEFGLLASSGILVTLLSTYIVVASLITLSNKIFMKKKIKIKSKKEDSLISGDTNKVLKWIIFSISIILFFLTIIFIFNLKNIRFEYNSKKLEVKGQKSIETTEMIQEKFNISTDPAIFYSYSREEEKDFYNSVSDRMNQKQSKIGNVLSLSGILVEEDIQKERLKYVKKIKKELDDLPVKAIKNREQKDRIKLIKEIAGSAKVINEDDLPANFSRRFIAYDNNKKLYITQVFPKKVLFDAREMKEYVADIRKIEGKKSTYFPTGMHILYVYLIDTILKESKIFISIVFFIIWVLLLIDFKKIKDSLIAMIPIIFGTVWLVEIMSIFGIKFNFMNIVVLPTVLGTGIDNGVHIFHRYRETNDIYRTIKKTGIANLGMSLTVALGWSALFFAHYQGLRTMAFVGVVGIIMTFIASVTIMPVVIILLEKGKNKS